MDAKALVDKLAQVLTAEPDVRLAWLFGSCARGSARPDSDVDVAVGFDADVPLSRELALQSTLERSCGRRVDLVRIDHASTLLRSRVARDGLVIVERAPFEAARWRAAAWGEWLDFAPAFDRVSEAFRQRLTDRHGGCE